MTKFGIQFHARNSEVIDFVINSVYKYDLYLGLIHFTSQFHCEVFDKHSIDSFPKVLLRSDKLVLFQKKPIMGAESDYQFTVDNPDALYIFTGFDDGELLTESSLSAIAEEDTVLFWKNVVKPLKKSFLKGAWITWQISGTKRFEKNHYYTAQAKLAYEQGVKITQFLKDNSYYLLDQE
jgi:hypothetical protein